jgi:hypothetical protein
MPTSKIRVLDQTSGADVATRTITEDSFVKHIQRYAKDSRLNLPAKRFRASFMLPATNVINANVLGLRKLNANAEVFIHVIAVGATATGGVNLPCVLGIKRATNVVGGVLVAQANLPKVDTASADATLEVRTGAVTGTKAAVYMDTFPSTPTLAVGGGYAESIFDSQGDIARAIRLTGDEGLIFDQVFAADVDMDYHVTLEWEEA